MDEKIYDIHGSEIEVVDGKIKPVLINGIYKLNDKPAEYEDAVTEYQETIDNDVIENIIRPHKSTITAAQNRARIKALQNKNKTKKKKSKTSSVTGMSATFPKHVGVTAKKHGGKITYKMTGGQVVDAGYE
jgi:hypothetical protein